MKFKATVTFVLEADHLLDAIKQASSYCEKSLVKLELIEVKPAPRAHNKQSK